MKTKKIIYYVVTALFSLLLLYSAANAVLNKEEVVNGFERMSFPIWLTVPLAIAKFMAVIAIWTRVSPWLKEWSYAGAFLLSLIALGGHLNVADGHFQGALGVAVLVLISRYLDPQVFYKRKSKL